MSALSNPYVGLRPFDSHESLLFYGRRKQIPDLLQKLYDTRFLAVVGSSGCGKSSLIRAGLIPHLKAGFLVADRDQWRIVEMKPGNRPLYHLSEAINEALDQNTDPKQHDRLYEHIQTDGIRAIKERLLKFSLNTNANILILIDQFEEIFRFALTKSHDEAVDFVSILIKLSQTDSLPVYTVLTIRSDFIGACDTFQKLPEAMNQSQYLVPRMTRDQRRQAIEGPAAVNDIKMPEKLVQRLLNDSSNNPDQLPVLQHALMRTWHKWHEDQDRPQPEIHHYKSIGQFHSALSLHADEILSSLPEPQRLITERIFKALTAQDVEGRGTRRNTTLQELCDITNASFETVVTILDQFRKPSCSFIMPSSKVELSANTEIDISHESLMRGWNQLDKWVSEEAVSAKHYIRLAERAELYKDGKVDFLTEPELTDTETWHKDNFHNKAWALRYHAGYEQAIVFLEKSIAVREEEKKQTQKQARLKKITPFVFIALIVLIIISIIFGVQNQKLTIARKKAEIALQEEKKALEKAENTNKLLKSKLDEIEQLKETINPLTNKQGRLYIKTHPNDADAIINNDKIEGLPYSDGMKLFAGIYTIRVIHKDYIEKQIDFSIKAGKENQLPMIQLKPKPGKISIHVIPEDAEVFLNSKKVGKGKTSIEGLTPGLYHIKLQKENFLPVEKEITIDPNQFKSITEHLVFTNQSGMKFVYIKPGTFIMGSPENEMGRDNDENQHTVRLTKAIYMQTTEVTQGQWIAIMYNNPSYFARCGDDCPVESVSLEDIQEFVKELNTREPDTKYRLPTEAEWEYAARAGSSKEFANGAISTNKCDFDKNLDKMGWYCGNSCVVGYEGGYNCSNWGKHGRTEKCKLCGIKPVGMKQPNSWGLYDMHGNVLEWCKDSYSERIAGGIDPLIINNSRKHVARGGSWRCFAWSCRSAERISFNINHSRSSLGFRLVCIRKQ